MNAGNVTRIAPAKAAAKQSPVAVMRDKFGQIAELVALRNSERITMAVRKAVEISGRFPGDRDRALSRLERLPCRVDLEEEREALRVAVYVPAGETEVRAILGLMLEGIPAAASGATAGYGDWLADSIVHADNERDPEAFPRYRGFSPAVLFATAQRLVRTSTFTPSVAEVLTTARKVRAEHYEAFATTNRLLALRMNAEEIVEESEPCSADDVAEDADAVPF